MTHKRDIALSIISGLLFIPAFPPYDIYPVAWIALVPLLFALREKSGWRAFSHGFLTGFIAYCGTMYWVYHSMYYYGYIPAALSILFMMLLSCYLALYTGMFSLAFSSLSCRSKIPSALLVPVIWVSLELLRTYAFTGLPWALLGYTQYSFLPAIQIADVTGIYGVSFMVAAICGVIFDIATCFRGRGEASSRQVLLTSSAVLLTVLLCIVYGLSKMEAGERAQTVSMSVVQGNISQDKKWDRGFQTEVINTYKRLTTDASLHDPDLIVWPETAVPFIYGYQQMPTDELNDFVNGLDRYLLFGSVLKKETGGVGPDLSNSAVLLSPEGEMVSAYDKMHLVPYGEYVPLREYFPFIEKLVVAVGDFLSGKEAMAMEMPFAKVGNLICYEIIFPGLVRKFVDNGANVLVTITNDAWFGKTAAPYQHFSMAVFRAVENRVPVVRAANTGISGFIDSRGRILKKSDIFVESTLTQEISPGSERSFYTRYGDIFSYICIAVFISLLIRRNLN